MPTTVARVRAVDIGCTRPCRESSARCHISLTGLPIALDASAASSAASKKSLRPKEPPPCVTCTLTLSIGSPTCSAIFCWAVIGDFSPLQISARSARTSAIAQLVSSALLLANQNVNSLSTLCTTPGTSGTTSGISAALSSASTSASDTPSAVPPDQSTSSLRIASMHCPKVLARTATPVEIVTTWVTPGIFRTAPRLRTALTLPLSVGGRQTIVGLAPLTVRSMANFFLPVTASRASVRL